MDTIDELFGYTVSNGKEWKKFTSGMEFLDDNKKYRLEWELDSFVKYLRAWYGIIRKTHHTLTIEEIES